MGKSQFTSTTNLLYLLLILVPTAVLGECTCDIEEEDRDKSLSLKYKMVAIASILVAGAVGVFLPVLGKWVPALSPERSFFFIIKALAAGVILSTGFIHVLPDAFDSLSSPCLKEHPWGDFPFAGFIAMMAAIMILMVETWATATARVKSGGDGEDRRRVHTHATDGHAHASLSLDPETQLHRHRVTSQVLELGIVIHSVIIGIALGASESPKTIRPLIAALTFHQFFEGMGLGGCITQAKFNLRTVILMTFLFSIMAPGGIAIGIGISKNYKETSPTALIVEGVFNSASAGILIYMALVDLLSADFMSPKMQNNGSLRLGANVSLLLGAGCMSLLAKWA